MRLFYFAPVALLALSALGCGGSDTNANDPSQQNQGNFTPGQNQYQQGGTGQYQQGGTGQYTQPTPTATTTTPVPTGTTTTASAGSPATPIAAAAAAAAQPILQGMAASEVKGMQPDGQPFAAQFQEGQILEQPINIQAGKCYSVIGASIGIQELDIQLVLTAAPLPPQVLAQDNTTGPQATLGGNGQCFKNALPIGGTGKVVVKATKGAGLGIAQVYIK